MNSKQYKDERAYLGNRAQVFGVKPYTMTDGAADGLRAMELYNRAGLRMTLLPGRGLDIGELSYKGENLAFISPSGYVDSGMCQPNDQWTRSFTGGFLTTCGLANVGRPCDVDGKHYSQHGLLSHIPAEAVSITEGGDEANPVITVSGTVREATIFGYQFALRRSISLGYNDRFFTIHDRIENIGYTAHPYLVLYHFNFGFPFLDEQTTVDVDALHCEARDSEAEGGIAEHLRYNEPIPGYKEQCFFYQVKDRDGRATAGLKSPNTGLRCDIEYPKDPLHNLVQWKHMGAGEYVTALEPANCEVAGRLGELEKTGLTMLAPGEVKDLTLRITIGQL